VYINLKIEMLKILKIEFVFSSEGKKEVVKDEKGTDTLAAESK
jgi:hypothetical protein